MDHIRDLITQNRIREALDELANHAKSPSMKTEISVLKTSFNDLENHTRIGLINRSQSNMERTRIVYAALGYVDEIERGASSPEPSHENEAGQQNGTTDGNQPSQKSIFMSYAWGDRQELGESREKIVDELFDSLEGDGFQVIRDKKSMSYGDSIRQFMERLGAGELILVFISDKYLKSPNAMFELYEIFRTSQSNQQKFSQRILPIMVEFIKLDRPSVIETYLDHWEEEEKEWKAFVQKRFEKGQQVNEGQTRRLHTAQNIYANFGNMADWLIDINAMTVQLLSQNDFQKVKDAINQRLSDD